jgi:hypothetical protein
LVVRHAKWNIEIWSSVVPLHFVLSLENRQVWRLKSYTDIWRTFFILSPSFSLAHIIFGRKKTRWRWTSFREAFNFENRRKHRTYERSCEIRPSFNIKNVKWTTKFEQIYRSPNFDRTFAHVKGLCQDYVEKPWQRPMSHCLLNNRIFDLKRHLCGSPAPYSPQYSCDFFLNGKISSKDVISRLKKTLKNV